MAAFMRTPRRSYGRAHTPLAVRLVISAMCRPKKQQAKVLLLFALLVAVLCVLFQIRPPCLWSFLVFRSFPSLQDTDVTDVTIVTAYFNLGHLSNQGTDLSLYKYLHWASVFQHVQNPLVVYTDSEQVENLFLETRRHLANTTKIIRVHRSDLRAFRDVDRIRKVFSDPDYPKHYPNTVVAEYPCSQHAKYELVQETIRKQYFSFTKYIAWVDIGYYRYLTHRHRKFWIVAPPDMDDSRVAMTEVYSPDLTLTPDAVFRQNVVWVGGGMSLATREVYGRFVSEYQQATDRFLGENLSSTDQQVVYSMYTHVHKWSQKVQTRLQTYRWTFSCVRACWWYLGYHCYREVD